MVERHGRRDEREVHVAHEARDLFEYVVGQRYVAGRAPRRSRDAKGAAAFLGLEAEAVENLFDVGGGQIAAEALAQEVEAHLDDGAVERTRIYVGVRRDLRLGEIFLEGRERDGGRVVHALRVEPLFVARRGVGAQLEALRRAAYAERAEVRYLKDELRRIFEYRVELAAHDSREADGRFLVRYDEVLGGERQRLAVKQHELLALVGAAHDDAA